MTCRLLLIAVLLLVHTFGASADEPEMAVPVDVQLALFANVLKLDHNFDGTRALVIGIVYQEEYRPSVLVKDDVIAALHRMKPSMRAIALEIGSQDLLRQRIAAAAVDVIYVTPLRAVDVAEIARITRGRGVRTFTGVPAYVDAGLAVGIGMRKNRPLIIINLAGARAEGASFSSQLLTLARIVGPL